MTAWAATFAILLSFVDSTVRRLPGRLTWPALTGVTAALAVTAAASSRLDRLIGVAAGFVLLGGFYLTVMLIRPQAIGLGDPKWAAVIGAVLGWFGVRTALAGLATGVVLGAVISLLLLASRRVGRQHALAHGPFISLGALVAFSLHPHP